MSNQEPITEHDAMVAGWAAATINALRDMRLPSGTMPALLLNLSISVSLGESVSKKMFLERAAADWDLIEKERRKVLASLSDA